MDQTIVYYEQNADSFIEGTLGADMDDLRQGFLDLLPEGSYILDFGCGSGRDTKAFLDSGYRVDAVDGSEELCRRASDYTGIPVKHMLFQELSDREQYDGIWACASILHLKRRELPDVLQRISDALKPGGILYTSFKYGNFEGMREGRYYSDFTEETLAALMEQVPSLLIFDQKISCDVRPGREEERWINILARRI